MATAITSIVFSVLALILSGAAFGWQVLSWFLTGGRIKIKFKPGTMKSLDIETMPETTSAEIKKLQARGFKDLAGVIEVHNKGRMAVFVDKVGVVTGGEVLFKDSDPVGGPDFPHKLEPGERARWALRGYPQAATYSDFGKQAPLVRCYATLSSGKRRISKKSADVRDLLSGPRD